MIIHGKLSGEVLSDNENPVSAAGLDAAASQFAELYWSRKLIGAEGVMAVIGAGNHLRGQGLADVFGVDSEVRRLANSAGRIGTMSNSTLLHAALTDTDIPSCVVAAPNMAFSDTNIKFHPYDLDFIQAAYDADQIVVMAGGMGADHYEGHPVTTDAAVVFHMIQQARLRPETPSVALKETKLDGIFTADPKVATDPERFVVVSARHMLDNNIGGVDKASLAMLVQEGDRGANAELHVYSAGRSTVDVLRDRAAGRLLKIGTVITSREVKPEVWAGTTDKSKPRQLSRQG